MTRRHERAGGPQSQRQLRVGEAIRQAIAEMLARGEIRHPLVAEASLTVTEVRPSRDLRNATVYVTELGGEVREEVLAALERVGPVIGGRLARMLHLKYAPGLQFRADTSFAEAERIERLLLEARRDRVGDDDEAGAGDAPDGGGRDGA